MVEIIMKESDDKTTHYRNKVLSQKATLTAEQLLEIFAEQTVELLNKTDDESIEYVISEIMRIVSVKVTNKVMKKYGKK